MRWFGSMVLVSAFLGSNAAAATLDVDAFGILLGASGVDVGGASYDVTFQSGSCASIFMGCNDVSDFQFATEADATTAAAALLDQVFLDTAVGQFDTSVLSISGCELRASNCSALVAFAPGSIATATVAINEVDEASDRISVTGLGNSSVLAAPFAVFTEAAPIAPVPLPASGWLLAFALGVIGLGKRQSWRST